MWGRFGCFKSAGCVTPHDPPICESTKEHTEIAIPQPSINTKSGFLYILREREFLKTNELIYKIGKTINMRSRMPAYPKDSRLYLCFYCSSDIDVMEKHMILVFDDIFVKRVDIGAEYYEGDIVQMLTVMTQYCLKQPVAR
jgi:hypothetical protein